jgi:hypothetical protein
MNLLLKKSSLYMKKGEEPFDRHADVSFSCRPSRPSAWLRINSGGSPECLLGGWIPAFAEMTSAVRARPPKGTNRIRNGESFASKSQVRVNYGK